MVMPIIVRDLTFAGAGSGKRHAPGIDSKYGWVPGLALLETMVHKVAQSLMAGQGLCSRQ